MLNGPTPLLDRLSSGDLAESLPVEELAGILLAAMTRPDADRLPSIQTFVQEVERWHSVALNARSRIQRAISEAWWWLVHNGLIMPSPSQPGNTSYMEVTRGGRRIAEQGGFELFRQAAAFPRGMLHPRVAEKAWAAYLRADYDVAVLQAFKEVEVAVRLAANLNPTLVGVTLMRTAFDKKTGPLTDQTAVEGEREALAHLFSGAIGSFKNPHSHRDIPLTDPVETGEMLMLASMLLRIVDARRE